MCDACFEERLAVLNVSSSCVTTAMSVISKTISKNTRSRVLIVKMYRRVMGNHPYIIAYAF